MGGFFIHLAERGGGTDPETSLPDCSQIANRTCVLCCVPPIIAAQDCAVCRSNDFPWRSRDAVGTRAGAVLIEDPVKLNAPILHWALEAI